VVKENSVKQNKGNSNGNDHIEKEEEEIEKNHSR
jgi:hypothetical protein